MVSPLLLSRGLRKEENNEKKRKRVKRNEIQCMNHVYWLCLFLISQKNVFKKAVIFYYDNRIIMKKAISLRIIEILNIYFHLAFPNAESLV